MTGASGATILACAGNRNVNTTVSPSRSRTVAPETSAATFLLCRPIAVTISGHTSRTAVTSSRPGTPASTAAAPGSSGASGSTPAGSPRRACTGAGRAVGADATAGLDVAGRSTGADADGPAGAGRP